jgi:hypothetical protein
MSNLDLDVKLNFAAITALELASPTLTTVVTHKAIETISSNKSIVSPKLKSGYSADQIFEIDFPEAEIKLLKEAFTMFQTNEEGVHF